MEVNTQIRTLREGLGLTVTEFADAIDLKPAYYDRVERGYVIPGRKGAWKIAKFLGDRYDVVEANDLYVGLTTLDL